MPAPWESCVCCYRGDTDTAVAFQGEAEFAMAGLIRLGVPKGEAGPTVQVFCEHELGCDPGMVPAGDFTYVFRLCPDCAAKAGVPVGKLPDNIPTLRQPPEMRLPEEEA
jgi:hypothetical protein